MKVLIAPLGGSPAVVTETIDALKANEKVNIEKVVVVCTNNDKILKGFEDLKKQLEKYYSPSIKYDEPVCIESDDIRTPEDNLKFMDKMHEVIEKEKEKGNDIYISIAGGRKTMSALAALAAQIHGINKVYHVLINDPEVEKEILQEKDPVKQFHPDPKYLSLIRFPPVSIDLKQNIEKMVEIRETLPKALYETIEKAIKESIKKREKGKKYVVITSISSMICFPILHVLLGKFLFADLPLAILISIGFVALICAVYFKTKEHS